MWDLIVSVPDHCLSFYFLYYIMYYILISAGQVLIGIFILYHVLDLYV